MSTTEIGRRAEAAAATYLDMRGFKIIEQNFRRPRCEIDIIAQKDEVIHFVEVKYRRNDDQGTGLDAISATKLRQMELAADIWVEETKWPGGVVLSAVELQGPNFIVMSFVENAF
jgi:putative endonuclease